MSDFMKGFQELKEKKEAMLRSTAVMQSNTKKFDEYIREPIAQEISSYNPLR